MRYTEVEYRGSEAPTGLTRWVQALALSAMVARDRISILTLPHSLQPLRFLCFSSIQFSSVQFSSVPRPIGSSGGPDRRFSGDSFAVSSAEGHCEQFRHGQGGPLFDVVHPAFHRAEHGVVHPPRCPEGLTWRGCRGA